MPPRWRTSTTQPLDEHRSIERFHGTLRPDLLDQVDPFRSLEEARAVGSNKCAGLRAITSGDSHYLLG
jgi:hypothetical protein